MSSPDTMALFVKERKILRMVMPSPRMKEKALMIS